MRFQDFSPPNLEDFLGKDWLGVLGLGDLLQKKEQNLVKINILDFPFKPEFNKTAIELNDFSTNCLFYKCLHVS